MELHEGRVCMDSAAVGVNKLNELVYGHFDNQTGARQGQPVQRVRP